jgi:type II secretory pathway component PulF
MEQRKELSGLKYVTAALRQQVREGISFSSALRAASSSFGELYCKLVAAGELSGSLGTILRRQSKYLSTMQELQSRVISALIYPAFISVAGVVLLFVFMTVLVPQLTSLFNKTGKGLPFLTKALIAASGFMGNYWWALLGGAILISLAFWQYIQLPEGRSWWDEAKLKLPLVGAILTARFYAQFAETVATLVTSGVPLLNGLRLINTAVTNVYLSKLLNQVIDIVAEGGSLSRALQKVGHFPPVFTDMVSIGEQTGDLGASLEKIAKRYDKELNKKIERLTALIQPTIIVIMAVLVGVVAYSMITGIFQAVSGIRQRVT